MPFAHRLASPERLETYTRNEFERLIATLTPLLDKLDVDPRDPNTGDILYGQLAINAPMQIQNTFNFPTLSKLIASDINTFQHEDRVLLRLRPSAADRSIHGFQAPAGPDRTPLLIIYNDDSTYDLTLKHQSSSATDPRDRMILAGGADLELTAGDARACWLGYSHTQNRWVQLNTSKPAGFITSTTETEVSNTAALTSVYSRATRTPFLLKLWGRWKNTLASGVASASFFVECQWGAGTVIADDAVALNTGMGRSDTTFRTVEVDILIIGGDALCVARIGGAIAQTSWASVAVTQTAFYEADDLAATGTVEVFVRHSGADANLVFTVLGVAVVEL